MAPRGREVAPRPPAAAPKAEEVDAEAPTTRRETSAIAKGNTVGRGEAKMSIFDWVFGTTPHEGFELTYLATPDAALSLYQMVQKAGGEASGMDVDAEESASAAQPRC